MRSHAFTLIEVLLALLLLGLGLLSVLGLTLAGTRDATRAMAMATAYSTARAALYDPALLDAGATLADPSVTGYLNGYFVVRTIEQTAIIPGGSGAVDQVRVNVYWGNSGTSLAGVNSLVRR